MPLSTLFRAFGEEGSLTEREDNQSSFSTLEEQLSTKHAALGSFIAAIQFGISIGFVMINTGGISSKNTTTINITVINQVITINQKKYCHGVVSYSVLHITLE